VHIRRSFKLLLLILIPLVVAVSGCSTTESITRKVLPESWANKVLPNPPNLKKRVMVFPLVDQAGLGPERTAQYSREFYDRLKESPFLILTEPPDGVFSTSAMESPQFGVMTHSSLVDFADSMGMNDLIIGVLNPVEISIQKTGIWPFDDWRKIFGVSVAVNVIDTASKTLLMTRVELEEFKVDMEEADDIDEKTFIDQISTESFPKIIEKMAEAVAAKLRREPWTGKILAVENGTVMINAGKEVGLEPDKRFEVFGRGKSVDSASGRTIYLFGDKLGLVQVRSVMEAHSLAEPISGGPFEAKQFVRFRP